MKDEQNEEIQIFDESKSQIRANVKKIDKDEPKYAKIEIINVSSDEEYTSEKSASNTENHLKEDEQKTEEIIWVKRPEETKEIEQTNPE